MASSPIKKFSRFEVVFREADTGDEMYIVHNGAVRLIKRIQNKLETLVILGKGDFFGEMSVIEANQTRNATALVHEENTELIVLNREQFERLLQGNVEIAFRIIRQYAQRLNESNEKLERLLRAQQELDTGIKDILSNVRRKPDGAEDLRDVFGWLQAIDNGNRLVLHRPEVLIGRRDAQTRFNPDLDLTDLDPNRTISRRHARLLQLDDGVYLMEEPGVVNGTVLNGKQIERGKIVRLQHNDRVQLGKIDFTFVLHVEKI